MTEKYRVDLEIDCAGAETANVIIEIAGERKRQSEFYHFTAGHDDDHKAGELASAASCYVLTAVEKAEGAFGWWPFSVAWWKPRKSIRRNLIKAAALIVAEIERLDRRTAAMAEVPKIDPDLDLDLDPDVRAAALLPTPHRARTW